MPSFEDETNEAKQALELQEFNKKKEEEKKTNEAMTLALDESAYREFKTMIHQYIVRLDDVRKLNEMDNQKLALIHKEKLEFNRSLEKYYEQSVNPSAKQQFQQLTEQQKTDKIFDSISVKIDNDLAKIDNEIKKIDSWNNEEGGSKFWVKDGKMQSWNDGLKDQSKHFADKEQDNFFNDFAKKSNLDKGEEEALKNAYTKARNTFQEQLDMVQEKGINEPNNALNLQIKYAGLMRNAAQEMNRVIDVLNKNPNRADNPIPKVPGSISAALTFVEAKKGDQEQIMNNMHNFLLAPTLDTRKKSLIEQREGLVKDKTELHEARRKSHCEFTIKSSKVHDREFMMGLNQVTMAKICMQINKERGTQALTVQKVSSDEKARNILKFEYGDEKFILDINKGKIYGDNVSPETEKMMQEVLKRGYQFDPEKDRLETNLETNHDDEPNNSSHAKMEPKMEPGNKKNDDDEENKKPKRYKTPTLTPYKTGN